MLLPLSIIQAALLAGGQVCVKLALMHVDRFQWSWTFVCSQLTNWWWLLCGICFGTSTALWVYILRHYPFSSAYPLSSLAYVFGLVAAWMLFGEKISANAIIGVLLIMAGCYFVAK